jgi:predicted DNA binding protein
VTERDGSFTFYSHSRNVSYCHSVPYFAVTTLGDGLLFDAQRRGSRYEWRVLAPDDAPVGELYDALRDGLPEGRTVTLRQVGTPTRWGEHVTTIADLPYEQRRALEVAVSMGYYETPRDASLGDIAAALGVAQSTLRYRLRRAEAWLTTNFVERNAMLPTTGHEEASASADAD